MLVLTIAGSLLARGLAFRDARRDSDRRAELAAALIGTRIGEATSLASSLRQFISTDTAAGVTNDQFARIALRWLSPSDLPAAAWVEQLPAGKRADYERRLGHAIVTPERLRKPAPHRSSYLPATLVSGFPPLDVRGIDLSRERGMQTALARVEQPGGVAATPLAARSDGTSGLFLVAQSPNVIDGELRPGALVVFVSEETLRAAASNPAGLELVTAGSRADERGAADTVREEFTVAGRRFAVVMPRASITGAGAILPWLILGAGLVLAALAGALGVVAARRAKARDDLDRIFTLSSDVIAVADFDGHFRSLNPAAERILGYSEDELLARPYLDFVHPQDRQSTAAEASAIGDGKQTLSFENRHVRKDGSIRVLEWKATPVAEEGVVYAMARDVSERRQAEEEVERLAEEQAALRRLATLVAEDAPPAEVFAKVAEETAGVIGEVDCAVARNEGDGTITTLAACGDGMLGTIRTGERFPVDGSSVVAHVLREGRPCRIDDYSTTTGTIAERGRAYGIRSAVGCPILVSSRIWGVIAVARYDAEAIVAGAEQRIAQFADLVATAVANADARAEVQRLAAEQAALRRVATLVARGVPPAELFSAVSREVSELFGSAFAAVGRFDPSGPAIVTVGMATEVEGSSLGARFALEDPLATATVYRTGRSARHDDVDWADVESPIGEVARRIRTRSTVASPITVDGSLWGAVVITAAEPLPQDAESRLEKFTELVATAISNATARAEVERLADEQAALRRVATLVAREASQAEIFGAIAEEIARLLGFGEMRMARFDDDRSAVVAAWGRATDVFPVGSASRLRDDSAVSRVFRTGQPVRIDRYETVDSPAAETARTSGVRSVLAAPIWVGGRLWGAMTAGTSDSEPLPPDTENRLGQFTELMATAIANAESGEAVARLVDEQAALGRVATLVARGLEPAEIFEAVTDEVGRLFGSPMVSVARFSPDGSALLFAGVSTTMQDVIPVGTRWELDERLASAAVLRTGRPARVDQFGGEDVAGVAGEALRRLGVISTVASPIVVQGHLWGVVTVSNRDDELPPDAEQRLAKFTELVATAVANAESQSELAASRRRIVAAADEARRRIERDLHDGTQQRLVSLALAAHAAAADLPPQSHEVGEKFSRIAAGLGAAVEELQELSRGIHPAILSDAGLRPALEALALRSPIPVALEVMTEGRFPEPVEVAAYFVASESLANAAKHSRSTRIDIALTLQNERLLLSVRDDGVGGADPGGGSGLVGLDDRVEALGGTITIESPAGGGTCIVVAFPIATASDHELEDFVGPPQELGDELLHPGGELAPSGQSS